MQIFLLQLIWNLIYKNWVWVFFFKSSFEDFYEAEVSVRLQAVIIIYVCQYGQLIIGFFLF